MKLLFFAALAEISGQHEITVEHIKTTEELKLFLSQKFPAISGLKFSIAVNKTIIHSNTDLHETDEVALLPPFSGG